MVDGQSWAPTRGPLHGRSIPMRKGQSARPTTSPLRHEALPLGGNQEGRRPTFATGTMLAARTKEGTVRLPGARLKTAPHEVPSPLPSILFTMTCPNAEQDNSRAPVI